MTDAPTNIDQSSPKKGRRRYGWWMVFALVVLLFAVGLPVVIQYQRQNSLIKSIEQAGGLVKTMPDGPQWMRSLLGRERMRRFDSVAGIIVVDPLIDDNWLRNISNFTKLERLDLSETQITDAGLAQLKGLTSLDHLYLVNTLVSDAGLEHLKGLTKLEWLSLISTRVSNAGLANLSELSNLRVLYLYETQITDAGLVHLRELTRLELLNLEHTKVSEDGVKELQAALPDCQIVWSKD